MTLAKVLENRIKLIEKDTPIYFSQIEQQKLGVTFMYYISIFFLIFGIVIALLSSMQISIFSERWIKSGLFYLCTLMFLLRIYGYGKYMTLKKHKAYLKQVLNHVKDYETLLPNSINSDLEKEITSKSIYLIHILMGALAVLGGVCFLYNLEFWAHFDLIIFLVWSIYGLLCFHKIQKIKQISSTFKNQLKYSAKKY